MKGHRLRLATILVTALAASQFSAGTARAQDAAYSFSTAPTSVQTPLSLGFLFTANQDLTIVSLGYYDDTAEGFVTAHTVGIFDSTGTLMVSATLDAGADAVLDGHFRYVDIDPITLAAGATYTAAATTGQADPWAYGDRGSSLADFDVHPAITIADNASRFVYQSDDQLRLPTATFGYTVYAGPNFKIGND